MLRVVYGKNFLKSANYLPKEAQKKLIKLIGILQEKPFHPLLHVKYLAGELAGLLSFRITRDWRVVFQFVSSDTIQLFRVAHRKDIYRRKIRH